MAFLIGLPIFVIALCLLIATVYSLIYEKHEPLLLKEKYRGKHNIRRIRR